MVEEAAAAPAAGTAEPGAADASAGAGAAGQEGAPAVDLTDYRLKVGMGPTDIRMNVISKFLDRNS